MNKIGLHVNWTGAPGLADFIVKARPAFILSLDHNRPFWDGVVQRLGYKPFMVGRHYFASQPLYNPYMNAMDAWFAIKPEAERMRGLYDAWVGYNECGLWGDAGNYNEFDEYMALWMHSDGFKYACLSASTGTPPGHQIAPGNINLWDMGGGWAPYVDAIHAADYIAIHEYDAPTMRNSETWKCLRYRRVWDILPPDCRKPILITECGIDGGGSGLGWTRYTNAVDYAKQLEWYDSEISKDSYVVGAAVFCCGQNAEWGTFDVNGQQYIAERMALRGGVLPEMPWNRHVVADNWYKRFGPGYNPNDAFGGFLERNPGIRIGPAIGAVVDDPTNPYLYQYYALAILYVKRSEWANVKVAYKETDLPLL